MVESVLFMIQKSGKKDIKSGGTFISYVDAHCDAMLSQLFNGWIYFFFLHNVQAEGVNLQNIRLMEKYNELRFDNWNDEVY